MTENTKHPEEGPPPDTPPPSEELTDRMADALAGTGEPTTQGMANVSDEAASETDEVLEEEKVKDEVEIQIDLLQDPDWVVRREAVITLGEMGDERCVQPLLKALQDGDWQVREVAVEALAQVGSPAVDGLIRYLRHWDIRKNVLKALGKVKDERVLQPLLGQLKSDEFGEDALDALVEVGPPAVEGLCAALKDKEEIVRKRAVIALGRIGDSTAVEALMLMLQDSDWFTRITAAGALEKIGDERGREAIKGMLKDPDQVVRMRVERILAAWKKNQAATA